MEEVEEADPFSDDKEAELSVNADVEAVVLLELPWLPDIGMRLPAGSLMIGAPEHPAEQKNNRAKAAAVQRLYIIRVSPSCLISFLYINNIKKEIKSKELYKTALFC